MPGLITHHIVAESVAERVDIKYTPAFMLGCLGPDVCYFHRAMPWQRGSIRAVGKKLHYSPPSELFNVMNRLLLEYRDDAMQSYVEGFLCHYALDSTVHPFVYWSIPQYKSAYGIKFNDSFIHNQIEYKMDALVLDEKYGITVKEYDLEKVVPTDEKTLTAASKMFSSAVNDLFPSEHLTAATVSQAYTDLSHNTRILQNPEAKRQVICSLERLLHTGPVLSPLFWSEPDHSYDYMNTAHKTWYNPTDRTEQSTESYIELASRAVDYTVELIGQLRGSLDRNEPVKYSLDKLFVNGKRIEVKK